MELSPGPQIKGRVEIQALCPFAIERRSARRPMIKRLNHFRTWGERLTSQQAAVHIVRRPLLAK
jgi:hypothetical protein